MCYLDKTRHSSVANSVLFCQQGVLQPPNTDHV